MNRDEVILQAINTACMRGAFNIKEAYEVGKALYEQDEPLIEPFGGDPIPTDPIKGGKGG